MKYALLFLCLLFTVEQAPAITQAIANTGAPTDLTLWGMMVLGAERAWLFAKSHWPRCAPTVRLWLRYALSHYMDRKIDWIKEANYTGPDRRRAVPDRRASGAGGRRRIDDLAAR